MCVLVFLLFCVTVLAQDGCPSSQQPPSCSIPHDADTSEIQNAFLRSSPPTVTVFAGHSALFRLDLNVSRLPGAFVKVFQDGCHEISMQCDYGDLCTANYIIDTVQLNQEGTVIQFYVFYLNPSDHELVGRCYDPPSKLQVKGPPPSVHIFDVQSNSCDSVAVTVSSIENDTTLDYTVFADQEDVYNLTSDSTYIEIPGQVLVNHTRVYLVEIIPTNPAGPGESNSTEFWLNFVNFTVDETQILIVNGTFYAKIFLKVNLQCVLTMPNWFEISSDCSNHLHTYYVDFNHIIKERNVITHSLLPNQRNCTYTVTDNGNNKETHHTKQSTFHTQKVEYSLDHELPDHILVTCYFIKGSTADGCFIRLVHIGNGAITGHPIRRLLANEHLATMKIGPLPSGVYRLRAHDLINGQYNTSVVVFEKRVMITFPSVSVSITKITSSSNLSTPSKSCDVGGCNIIDTSVKIGGIIGGITVVIILLLIITIPTVLVAIVYFFKKKRKLVQYRPQSVQQEPEDDIDLPHEMAPLPASEGVRNGSQFLNAGREMASGQSQCTPFNHPNSKDNFPELEAIQDKTVNDVRQQAKQTSIEERPLSNSNEMKPMLSLQETEGQPGNGTNLVVSSKGHTQERELPNSSSKACTNSFVTTQEKLLEEYNPKPQHLQKESGSTSIQEHENSASALLP